MRDSNHIRARAARILELMLLRPGMYGSGQSFESTLRAQLADLAFIDERDDELSHLFEELERDGLWGPCGAWGVLAELLGPGDHTEHLAAVYVPIASQLGCFQSQRRLDSHDWSELQSGPDWASRASRSRADTLARFGPPSYRCEGQQPKAFGYASSTSNAWLTFCFDDSPVGELILIQIRNTQSKLTLVHVRPVSQDTSTPEDAYRAFLISTLSGSEHEVRKNVLLHPELAALWTSAYPPDVARLLSEQFASMNILRVNPPDSVVYLTSDACPVPLAVVRTESRWAVDADPLVRLRGEGIELH